MHQRPRTARSLGTVDFKTTAIDQSAIPPRRDSGHNSQLSRESTPTHPASVTASVTIATARDDAGPATSGHSAQAMIFMSFREPPAQPQPVAEIVPASQPFDSPSSRRRRAEGSAASEFFDNITRPQWVMTYTHTLIPNA